MNTIQTPAPPFPSPFLLRVLLDEVESQTEDPTCPHALREARLLFDAVQADRPMPDHLRDALGRVLDEEVRLQAVALSEAHEFNNPAAARQAEHRIAQTYLSRRR